METKIVVDPIVGAIYFDGKESNFCVVDPLEKEEKKKLS